MGKKLTQEEFINSAIKVHGDKYSYHLVNYVNTDTHVDIWCNRCKKSFPQTPYKHTKRKQGCTKCNREIRDAKSRTSFDDFLVKSNTIHNFKFTYIGKIFQKKDKLFIKWQCNICNDIKEQPMYEHMTGRGCRNCHNNGLREQSNTYKYEDWGIMGDKSNNFDGFKCYEIKCTSKTSNETFYKIGKTFLTMLMRFSPTLYPFTYEVVRIHTGTAKEMSELETELKRKNKEFKYLPTLKFSGRYECFSKLVE